MAILDRDLNGREYFEDSGSDNGYRWREDRELDDILGITPQDYRDAEDKAYKNAGVDSATVSQIRQDERTARENEARAKNLVELNKLNRKPKKQRQATVTPQSVEPQSTPNVPGMPKRRMTSDEVRRQKEEEAHQRFEERQWERWKRNPGSMPGGTRAFEAEMTRRVNEAKDAAELAMAAKDRAMAKEKTRLEQENQRLKNEELGASIVQKNLENSIAQRKDYDQRKAEAKADTLKVIIQNTTPGADGIFGVKAETIDVIRQQVPGMEDVSSIVGQMRGGLPQFTITYKNGKSEFLDTASVMGVFENGGDGNNKWYRRTYNLEPMVQTDRLNAKNWIDILKDENLSPELRSAVEKHIAKLGGLEVASASDNPDADKGAPQQVLVYGPTGTGEQHTVNGVVPQMVNGRAVDTSKRSVATGSAAPGARYFSGGSATAPSQKKPSAPSQQQKIQADIDGLNDLIAGLEGKTGQGNDTLRKRYTERRDALMKMLDSALVYQRDSMTFDQGRGLYEDEETTRLTPDEFNRYLQWRSKLKPELQNEYDYDLRGYWKSGNRDIPKDQTDWHLPDTWKKRNHPTFSVESKFSTNENPGGTWDGEKFIPPTKTSKVKVNKVPPAAKSVGAKKKATFFAPDEVISPINETYREKNRNVSPLAKGMFKNLEAQTGDDVSTKNAGKLKAVVIGGETVGYMKDFNGSADDAAREYTKYLHDTGRPRKPYNGEVFKVVKSNRDSRNPYRGLVEINDAEYHVGDIIMDAYGNRYVIGGTKGFWGWNTVLEPVTDNN